MMPFVVTATWRAKPGQEEAVRALLGRIATASRAEPGCLLFWTHRSTDDPSTFFLYEQYASEAAFRAHAESEHVRTIVLDDAVHRLDERRRATFETLDDGSTARAAGTPGAPS
jgi:quinol monooxygenase YgiN